MSAVLNNVGPGAYLKEVDASQQTNGVATTIGCITAAFKKGPVGPNLVTAGSQFTNQYGPIDNSWGYGHVSALAFLNYGNRLLVNRIVDPATCSYSALSVFSGSNALGSSNYTFLAPASNLTLTVANAAQAVDNSLMEFSLYLSGPLVSGTSISATVSLPNSNGTAASQFTVPTVNWAASSDQTIIAFANALSNTFNSNGVPASVIAVNATTASTCTTIQILINNTVANYQYANINSVTVSGSNVTITKQNTELLQIFSKNPGADGNNIGVQITNANTAAPPQIAITTTLTNTADALSISGTINYNNVVTTITGTGTSAALAVQNFISNFTSQYGGISSGIYSINNLSLSIILYAPSYNSTFEPAAGGFTVTDTATTPVVLASTVVFSANASYNYFTLNVYYKNTTNPVESFVCSLNKQTDGFGNQQLITSVVNGSTTQAGSNYISVVYSGATNNPSQNISPSFLSGTTTSPSSPIVFLGGGQDGVQPTDSDIVTGIQALSSTEAYKFNILINAGYTSTAVQQALENLAATRMDCIAVLDMPSGMQSVTNALNYVNNTLGINSSYAAIYTPNLNILDTVNNEEISVPPSGYIAGQYAYTDQNYAVWMAPAGSKRGVLPNVLSVGTTYDSGDRGLLANSNINTIKAARNGSGNVIWDVLTLEQPRSLLSFVSIRRTFIYLEQSILTALEGDVFDNITSQTEFLITQNINAFLQPIKDAQGIANFYVLCNSTNNPASTTDIGQLNVTVYIVPVVPARIISLTAVVTPSTVTFQELITNGIV